MTTRDLNAMINSEILNYFSSFDTCEKEVWEDDDIFSIEFANNIDASHTVNERHARNSEKMQKNYSFSVVWKIRHQKDGVFVDICDDIHRYGFFPKFERADAKTIEVGLNVSCNIEDGLKKLFSK